MVGGSNFGELLGALFVFLFTQVIKTPMPWLRIDALMLLVLWYIPFWYPPTGRVRDAWVAAGSFIPVSFGWAAGDVSLAAYIQASLARVESQTKNVSALGAVMACKSQPFTQHFSRLITSASFILSLHCPLRHHLSAAGSIP
jgi:hypothetical protein